MSYRVAESTVVGTKGKACGCRLSKLDRGKQRPESGCDGFLRETKLGGERERKSWVMERKEKTFENF